MGGSERRDFLSWYEDQKSEDFDNRHVLEFFLASCRHRPEASVLSIQAWIYSNWEHRSVLESVTIASACNKVFRKRFLKPDTIFLIPTGGYIGNVNYRKIALMSLVYREKKNGCKMLHGRKGYEYRLPELPYVSVDSFCPEKNTLYKFCGCFWLGRTCLSIRHVSALVEIG